MSVVSGAAIGIRGLRRGSAGDVTAESVQESICPT
ncbi:hypothetical protein SDC9_126246 [bioreactor metagenome]|uniref:Uncharacterized protein n=1 Tax=bioreactor metagenome TaxID=1076179 RepID=A0A645CQK6_9ZZZZ